MTRRRGPLRLVHRAGQGRAARTSSLNPFGLTPAELRAEIRRCAARGWQLWEIRYRFAPDRKDSA